MMSSMFENPFIECTARDMEYRDVVMYWCQPYEYYAGLDENALMKNSTPIFVEGARGSGKTMLLKHLSYFCQRNEYGDLSGSSLLNHFLRQGSIGIYYRFKNDFGKLLATLKCSQTTREDIFEEYFHLYYSRELLLVLQDLHGARAVEGDVAQNIIDGLNMLFAVESVSLDDILKNINHRIENLDVLIRKIKYLSDIDNAVESVVSGIPFLLKMFEIVRKEISDWRAITLLILIDEYENVSAFHKVVNTYIKQTDAQLGITYRVGMRPEGISTYVTYIGQEQLQVGRDYLVMHLRVTNPKNFQRFLKTVAEKRLSKVSFFSANKLTRIEKVLGTREDWVKEALAAVRNRPEITFEGIKDSIIQEYSLKSIKDLLSYPANPLIEMQNVLWLNRGKSPKEIKDAMNEYLDAKKNRSAKKTSDIAHKYSLDFDMKYKYALLFSLLAKCGIRKKYYSFTTFSYLACGSVNDFLSLCRNTFTVLDTKSYDCLLRGEPIPAEVQDRGAREAATEQLDKIRLCEDSGTEMYTFAMNIGDIFGYYHRDSAVQFPETNQFAFENEAEIDTRSLLKRDLSYLLKWGVIEKKPTTQRISIGRRKGNLYYLNRMLAPIFGISYRTRGGYNFVIKTEIFEQMLSNSMDAALIISQNKGRSPAKKDAKDSKDSPAMLGQMSLFEGE